MEDDIKKDREMNPEASRFFEVMYKDAMEDWKKKHNMDKKMYPDMPMPYKPDSGNVVTRV
jgi:hypothetical protein